MQRNSGTGQNIIIAYSNAGDAGRIRAILMRNGIAVTAVTTSGAQVLAHAESREVGIVVFGYRLRDMMYRELIRDLPAGFRMLVITSPLHMDDRPPMTADRVLYLTTPLKVQELLQTLEMMGGRNSGYRKHSGKGLSDRGEDRRIIEKAKAILMERNHMTEPEAHHYLQKCAMDSGNKLTETAEMILVLAGSDL